MELKVQIVCCSPCLQLQMRNCWFVSSFLEKQLQNLDLKGQAKRNGDVFNN